jgi:carbon starvation protein
MDILMLMGGAFVAYLIAYHTYGKFLARKIFKLNDMHPVPSKTHRDGRDFVPTRRGILFGHHFTSIAGTGPIVGPAIAIIWGWLPALLWVVFGSIFIGAVHDFGSLLVSIRNEGKSLSEISARYINTRVRFACFLVVFFTVTVIIAVFVVVIASIFTLFPNSVIPVWGQIPIAVLLGRAVYAKGQNLNLSTLVAVIAMYALIVVGSKYPLTIPDFSFIPASGIWAIILLIYAWIASVIPVTTLLQPRDYINAWQLFVAMALLIGGAVFSALTSNLELAAPAVNSSLPAGTPSIFPFLFVIVACGAVSGFHSLVGSGTSSKQLAKESDSLFVGYGSMLLEGVLAVVVIVCVAGGIAMGLEVDGNILTGAEAWNHQYSSYIGSQGLGGKLAPVILGAANMMATIGIPKAIGTTLMGVFIASFASTTLDTSVRLQRYVVSELASDFKAAPFRNRYIATSFAVVTAAALAFAEGAGATGALKLWPLFGCLNQLLAVIALLVITLYLKSCGGLKYLYTLLPFLFMLIVTTWSMAGNEIKYFGDGNILLTTFGAIVFAIGVWITIETAAVFINNDNPLPEA